MEITQKQWKEFQEFNNKFSMTKEQYDELIEKLWRISLEQQKANDLFKAGITSRNLASYMNTYVFNESDSLDADNPFIMDFEVISEMIKIRSVRLSFKIKNFRAYSKSATEKAAVTSGPSSITSSGASSASSSASGGGSTPTTSSGGGQTSSSVGTPSGGGSTTPSGGGDTSGAGGGQTSSTESQYSAIPYVVGNIIAHDVGWLISGYSQNLNVASYAHTHTVANHTHTTPAHTHATPDHTHPAHSHTVDNHTHTVTIANHTHGIAHTHNIEHTHTVPAHTHDLTFGIYEEETSPTIMPSISRDNGITYSLPLGSYTKDQDNLDITRFIDKVGNKTIKFTSNLRCRISAMVMLKLEVKAR